MKSKQLFPIFVKDDFFTENEENKIWKGFESIHTLDLFKSSKDTGSAMAADNEQILKKNIGYFLNPNDIPSEDIENLYRIIMKVFHGTTLEYSKLDFWTYPIIRTIKHNILISYYEDSDYYLPHQDECLYTILMWFHKKPKKFSGGNLNLLDIKKEIKVKNNRISIIPSHAFHSVSPIMMSGDENELNNMGRYCISIFLS